MFEKEGDCSSMVFTIEKSVWPPEEAGASWKESLRKGRIEQIVRGAERAAAPGTRDGTEG